MKHWLVVAILEREMGDFEAETETELHEGQAEASGEVVAARQGA